MRPDDIPAVYVLSRGVHTDYPEREAVLAEKLALFPAGCFVLEADGAKDGRRIAGYAFSHPWVKDPVPSLDTFLTALPDHPTTYFIHDVTLDERVRGQGHAAEIVPVLVDVARSHGLTHMMLVAVNGAEVFWAKFGFDASDSVSQASVREKYGAKATLMTHSV
jgi:GNAT superfamily N-acetyltransferase